MNVRAMTSRRGDLAGGAFRRGAGLAQVSIESFNGDADRALAHSSHQTTLSEREIVDRRGVALTVAATALGALMNEEAPA